jgi:hypothetical protein
VSSAGMVIMQSWPVGSSHTCAGEPLGCIAGTGRREMPSGVAPTQWMCVRGIAFARRIVQSDRLLETTHWLVGEHRAQPGDIRRVGDPEQAEGRGLSGSGGTRQGASDFTAWSISAWVTGMTSSALSPSSGDHRIEVDQLRDPIRDPVGHGRDDQPGVAVAHEDHLGQVLLEDQPDDVLGVRVEPHLGTEQVRLVAVAGQRGREHAVPGGRQERDDALPAFAAVPRAVYQQICGRGRSGHEECPLQGAVRGDAGRTAVRHVCGREPGGSLRCLGTLK